MPVAFVVSKEEAAIVNEVAPKGVDYPSMRGAILQFRKEDVQPLTNEIVAYSSKLAQNSPELNAANRLLERLGSWQGKLLAQTKTQTPSPAPAKTASASTAPAPAAAEPKPVVGTLFKDVTQDAAHALGQAGDIKAEEAEEAKAAAKPASASATPSKS